MTTPADPKARVVEIISAALLESGANPWPKYLHDLVSDNLDSAGLLASAPVVPSVETLWGLLIKHSSFASVTKDGCEAIRNHLLTLGYKEPS